MRKQSISLADERKSFEKDAAARWLERNAKPAKKKGKGKP